MPRPAGPYGMVHRIYQLVHLEWYSWSIFTHTTFNPASQYGMVECSTWPVHLGWYLPLSSQSYGMLQVHMNDIIDKPGSSESHDFICTASILYLLSVQLCLQLFGLKLRPLVNYMILCGMALS